MGLFGGGYDKPGKGIDKNAPKKKGFFLYLDLITRKFSKFIQAGFIYSLLSLPLIALIYFLTTFVLYQPISAMQKIALENMQAMGVAEAEIPGQLGTITFSICSMFAVFFVTMWGSGPLSAALSYAFRCFTREEHVWLFSDGKDKFKENFKQGTMVLILDLLLFILAPIAITFYYNLSKADPSLSTLCNIVTYIMFLFLLVYTIMHPYMYQLMITFEGTFRETFKNALLLAIAKFPLNLLFTVITAAIIVLPAAFFGAGGSLILVICAFTFGYMFLRYPIEFYAARTIKKLIIDEQTKKEKNTPKIVYDEEI